MSTSQKFLGRLFSKRRGFLVCLLFVVFVFSGAALANEKWPGVDETVVEKYAGEQGRTPTPGLIDVEGDALLFAFLMAGAAGGFVLGYYYRDQFSRKRRGEGR